MSASELCAQLASEESIETLHLSVCRSAEDFAAVLNALTPSHGASIRCIALHNATVAPIDMLLAAIDICECLRELTLSCSALSDRALGALLDHIIDTDAVFSLRALTIYRMDVAQHSALSLSNLLHHAKELQMLDIRRTYRLQPSSFALLEDAVLRSTSIRMFLYSTNYVNTSSMNAIESHLRRNRARLLPFEAHECALDTCIALRPLQLPPYVVLEIINAVVDDSDDALLSHTHKAALCTNVARRAVN